MRYLRQKRKQVGGDGVAVDASLRVWLDDGRQVYLVYVHQRVRADGASACFQVLIRSLEVGHRERPVTELERHEAVAVFVNLFLVEHPVPDVLLAENVGHLAHLGMEVQPLLRVVLHELAVPRLLRYNKVCTYLRELPSLEVPEIALCQELGIFRHVMVVALPAQDVLLLQGIALAKRLHDARNVKIM